MNWDSFWLAKSAASNDLLPRIPTLPLSNWLEAQEFVTFSLYANLISEVTKGTEYLECGSGKAAFARYMARKGYQISIIDKSQVAVDTAQKIFSDQNIKGNIFSGDLTHMDFLDESYDVVYSGGVLEYFANLNDPIMEMGRVLRPGGVFLAAMVPRKFSIQTLADFHNSLVSCLVNFSKLNITEALKYKSSIPPSYSIADHSLKNYQRACKNAGLINIRGFTMSPFPRISLPQKVEQIYGKTMVSLAPSWQRLNLSNNFLMRLFGITYVIIAQKPF